MNFEFTEEQTLLGDSLNRYLERQYDFETRKRIVGSAQGFSAAAWSQFAEMGLLAIPIPEDHGGFGGGVVDLIGVMRGFGDALVVEPFIPTAILGAGLVARLGDAAMKADILPTVAEGRMKLAFAHGESDARYQRTRVSTRADRTQAGWTLTGGKTLALGAPAADRLLVSARTAGDVDSADGISVFLLDRNAPGLHLTPYRSFDDEVAADLRLDGVMLGEDALVGPVGEAAAAIDEVLDRALALQYADMLGAMEYAHRATLDYLKTRKQFGVPIGSFQALQHRSVDMLTTIEQARSMVYLAATSVDGEIEGRQSPEQRRIDVSAAGVKLCDAARLVSQEAIQLHGGMGMTEEMKVSHTFRRLTALGRRLGDAEWHLQRYADAVLTPAA